MLGISTWLLEAYSIYLTPRLHFHYKLFCTKSGWCAYISTTSIAVSSGSAYPVAHGIMQFVPANPSTPAMSMSPVLIFLLLALFACQVNAAHHVQPAILNKEPHASFDVGAATAVEKAVSTRFSELHVHNEDLSFSNCLAHYANEASRSGLVSPTRMTLIRKTCERQYGPVQKPISAPVLTNSLTQTGVRGMRRSTRQKSKGGRISSLLRRARRATLQYIFSRLRKAIRGRISCKLPFNLEPGELDETPYQRWLARRIQKLLENADHNTVKEACKELRELLDGA